MSERIYRECKRGELYCGSLGQRAAVVKSQGENGSLAQVVRALS